MATIPAEMNAAKLSNSIDALVGKLAEIRDELATRQSEIQAGNTSGLREAERAIADLRQWLRIAVEAEAQLENRKKQVGDVINPVALDLNDARAEIGRRLDRLRQTRDARDVPEQPQRE